MAEYRVVVARLRTSRLLRDCHRLRSVSPLPERLRGRNRSTPPLHDPFFGIEPYPLPGPVFIHEIACKPYPNDAGFPEDLRRHDLTLTAYGRGRKLLAEERVERGGKVDKTVAHLLGLPSVDYIHVSDTEAGCYDFRIEHMG